MATPSCWRCLLPSTSSNVSSKLPPLVSPFSTAAALAAAPTPKKKAGLGKVANQRKTLRIKKKAVVKTGRPPAPGERKAIRKRIVLSNSNALEVQSLMDMTAELNTSQIGQVFGIPSPVVDQLRAVGAFKTTQGWSLFRRPTILVRDKSVELAMMMQSAADAKKTSRTIISGQRGAGKSTMLFQAMATAFVKGWIVLNIPEG
jgi:small subunit ribosomal protein S29